MSIEMIELDNLLELECEAGIRHMLAERNAVGVITSMTIQTADVFIAIRHAVIGTERHIETSTNQSNVTDTTIPRSGYRINNNIQQSYYFFFYLLFVFCFVLVFPFAIFIPDGWLEVVFQMGDRVQKSPSAGPREPKFRCCDK